MNPTSLRVGDILHYWPYSHEEREGIASGYDQPLAAIVAHVHTSTMVNLVVFDANGRIFARCCVTYSDGSEWHPTEGYCCRP